MDVDEILEFCWLTFVVSLGEIRPGEGLREAFDKQLRAGAERASSAPRWWKKVGMDEATEKMRTFAAEARKIASQANRADVGLDRWGEALGVLRGRGELTILCDPPPNGS